MSDRGVRLSSSRSGPLVNSGQLVWVDHARPPILEGHISFVGTPIWVLLDSMENPLSQEYIHILEEDIRCQVEVLDRACPGQVSSSGLTTNDLQLRNVISLSFQLRFWCSWSLWNDHYVKKTFICLRRILDVRPRC